MLLLGGSRNATNDCDGVEAMHLSPKIVVGLARIYTVVAALIDTNILVYRFDSRYPAKQKIVSELLRAGARDGSLRIPHQALLEFVAVMSRIKTGGQTLLSWQEILRETEELLIVFPTLYPNAFMFRTALRGVIAYQLSWFDAHLWAYAEHFGLEVLLSEDFEHGRVYGSVRVVNPFLA